MNCPNCGSHKVRTYDNEALYHAEKDKCEKEGYNKVGFDSEIYVSTICDNCGHKGNLMGVIQWETPKPKIETYRVNTAMGKVVSYGDSLTFLSDEEAKELDTIGYTGRNSEGKKMGRPRGYMRQFGISRVTFREMASAKCWSWCYR